MTPTGPLAARQPNEPHLLMVGVDHHTAALELRERVAYSHEEGRELLEELLALPEIAEACLLSTCNRTEIYIRPEESEHAFRAALSVVFTRRAPEVERQGRFVARRQEEASRHLLEVAAGLESMILGEPEILGQVRQAARLAEDSGAAGTVLRHLFQTAVTAGGRARKETGISAGAVSLGYTVVDLSRNIFKRLDRSSALILGAGEIARMTARALQEKAIGSLQVANRTAERAEALLREVPGAQRLPFEARTAALSKVDVVVATTAARHLLTRQELAEAMARRAGRPLLVVDLGVPRNVEAEAATLANLFLYDLDSLETLIQRNLKRRRQEIPRVQEIIEDELERFYAWYRSLEAGPLIAHMYRRAEAIRRRELDAVLERFPPELHEDLQKLTRSLVRKLLHHPSRRLRAGNGEPIARLDLVRELFALDDLGDGSG